MKKEKKSIYDEIAERYENGEVTHLDTAKVNNGKFIKRNVVIRFMAVVVLRQNILWVLIPAACHRNISRLYLTGSLNNFIYTYYISIWMK